MITLAGQSANELYIAAADAVLRDGVAVHPRGLETREILGVHLRLTDPRRRFVDLPPARVINPAFAVAEALWIVSGSDAPWIYQYNKALTRYADDGVLQGAYGPRLRRWNNSVDQLDHVRRTLTEDPDSRQAVVQLYNPGRDTRGYRDVPCTLGYRFFVRQGRLRMHTTMRSQDLWLGFPYDVFTATLIQELMAGWLGVELGDYHHTVDSLHLYANHHDSAATVAAEPTTPSVPMPPVSVPWKEFAAVVGSVIDGAPPTGAGDTWGMFAAIMASYRAWSDGDRATAHALSADVDSELGAALRRWYQLLTADHQHPAVMGVAQ
ncbi:thymidylate synthase [Actinophytocola sp.]|uniref:thymidylate synthase n=1 Tax=Actinophytocola sp. TaxID=1872138 RepID=UPI003D6BDE4E